MKTKFEEEDVEAIAQRVSELLQLELSGNKKIDEGDLFDVSGLAKYLGVSETWIYERTHFKEIPHLKIKGHLRFRKNAIDKWLDSYNVPAVDTPSRILRALK